MRLRRGIAQPKIRESAHTHASPFQYPQQRINLLNLLKIKSYFSEPFFLKASAIEVSRNSKANLDGVFVKSKAFLFFSLIVRHIDCYRARCSIARRILAFDCDRIDASASFTGTFRSEVDR